MPPRSRPIARKTRIRKRNAERKARLDAEAFGAHADYVRRHPCRICGHMPVDAHHEKSRGAGGKAQHLVPLCRTHHIVRHSDGKRTFARKHRIDLDKIAAGFWRDSPANPANVPEGGKVTAASRGDHRDDGVDRPSGHQ